LKQRGGTNSDKSLPTFLNVYSERDGFALDSLKSAGRNGDSIRARTVN
jgi:hypothetical protein